MGSTPSNHSNDDGEKAIIDWQTAVRTQYGIEPTADAIQASRDGWGWMCAFVVDPVQGAMVFTITVPMADGDAEQLGVGATSDEATRLAQAQLPDDPPVD